jgi:hypothetical protein
MSTRCGRWRCLPALTGRLEAANAAGLFALAERVSGGHQLIRRLGANSNAFDELSADVRLTLDPDVGPAISLSGLAGGSAYRVTASGTGLAPGGDGPRTVTVRAENPEAYRIFEQLGFAVLPLEGVGPAALQLNASGGADDGDMVIDAQITAAGAEVTLDGNARIPAEDPASGLFSLVVTADDVEPFVMMFGHSLPQAGAGLPLSMTASLAMNDDMLLLSEIAGRAEDNAFAGRLEFDRSAADISGEGRLRVDFANLEWLAELALGPQLFGNDGATWSDQPFLPPAPGQPQLRIALEAGQIDLSRGGVARNVKADLSTGLGLMSLENVEADWFGGRLGGRVSLSNADGSVFLSGRIDAKDTDLAALERAVRGASVFSGTSSASVSLEGTGKSVRELVSSLAGGGELSVGGLAVTGLDPTAFDRILGRADREGFEIETGAVTDLVAEMMSGGQMTTESLGLPFTLTGGVMRFSNTGFSDEGAELAGDARVDLVGLRLQSDWRLTFEPGVEAIAGGDPSVVFTLGGLLVDPAVSIDAGQLTNYLSMRAFERERRKVELLQAGVVEKQRLRREIALLNERAAQREAAEAARLAAEEAARIAAEQEAQRAAEEAARQAEEQAQRDREQQAAAQRAAEEAARLAAEEEKRQAEEEARRLQQEREAAQRAAEEAARQEGLADGPGAIERRPLPSPLESPPTSPADPPSAIADDPQARDLPRLRFDDLPGVEESHPQPDRRKLTGLPDFACRHSVCFCPSRKFSDDVIAGRAESLLHRAPLHRGLVRSTRLAATSVLRSGRIPARECPVEHSHTDCRGQISGPRLSAVDFGNQCCNGKVAFFGHLPECSHERVFKGDAGAVAMNAHRVLAHSLPVGQPGASLNVSECRDRGAKRHGRVQPCCSWPAPDHALSWSGHARIGSVRQWLL